MIDDGDDFSEVAITFFYPDMNITPIKKVAMKMDLDSKNLPRSQIKSSLSTIRELKVFLNALNRESQGLSLGVSSTKTKIQ